LSLAPASRPRRARVALTLLVGSILGGAALWLAFRGLDIGELRRSASHLRWSWTLVALGSNFLSLALLTLRWRLLFFPDHRSRRLAPLFRAIAVGQMLNIVLPLRLGEVGRLYLLAREDGVSKSRVVATLAVEKALDLAMFALALLVAFLVVSLPPGVALRGWTMAVAPVVGLTLLWVLSRRASRVEALVVGATGRLPRAAGVRVAGIAARFLEGLGALADARVALAALAWSALAVSSSALTNYLTFLAFGWTLSPLVALFLFVLIQVGFVSPSLPGTIGLFHYLVVVGLAAYGVERGPALAYAWVLYAVALLPRVVLGLVVLMIRGRGLLAGGLLESTSAPAAASDAPSHSHD
jgi:glycosyltransferase 2 family protein